MSENLRLLGEHSKAMEPGDEKAVFSFEVNLRVIDGQIVEHWGGPHCQDGVGLTH